MCRVSYGHGPRTESLSPKARMTRVIHEPFRIKSLAFRAKQTTVRASGVVIRPVLLDRWLFGRRNCAIDNNFQTNGTEVNDLSAESSISGGVPVPNPDAILEFKIQAGRYDASCGRNAVANVDIVTKSGTNQLRGDLWKYFRNTVLVPTITSSTRQGGPQRPGSEAIRFYIGRTDCPKHFIL